MQKIIAVMALCALCSFHTGQRAPELAAGSPEML